MDILYLSWRILVSQKFTLLNTPPPFTAESTGKLWLPGLRAELPSTHTQDTHAGVLAVHRVFLFSICIRLPLVGCGVYALLCKNCKDGVNVLRGLNAENQRKAVAYILEISHYYNVHFVNVVYQIIC